MRPDVDAPIRRLWSEALCAIAADPEGAKALRRVTGADGFVPVSPETVDELKGLVSLCSAQPS